MKDFFFFTQQCGLFSLKSACRSAFESYYNTMKFYLFDSFCAAVFSVHWFWTDNSVDHTHRSLLCIQHRTHLDFCETTTHRQIFLLGFWFTLAQSLLCIFHSVRKLEAFCIHQIRAAPAVRVDYHPRESFIKQLRSEYGGMSYPDGRAICAPDRSLEGSLGKYQKPGSGVDLLFH